MENTSYPLPIGEDEHKVGAWALNAADQKHTPIWIPRGNVGDHHVKVDMIYSGICHSDCHIGRNMFGSCQYPCVTGHELFGQVSEVGPKVTKVKVGDYVGVGVMVDACLDCDQCKNGDEQYCVKGNTNTYQGKRQHGRVPGNKDLPTYGGYSTENVVHEHFVCKVPDGLPHEAVGPILCAGITLFDPLVHWGANGEKKMKIGIIGIGGLGTMGIKYAAAMGNHVVAISSNPNKEQMAKTKGAHDFICASDEESMKKHGRSLDLILNTVSVDHDINTYLPLVARSGTIVQLGIVAKPHPVNQIPLFINRLSISGSCIGGIKNTQDCLEFSAKHNIYPDVEVVTADKIDDVWEKLEHGSNATGNRYVIDIKKSAANASYMPKE